MPKVLGRFLAGSGSEHELRQQLDLYVEVREKWVQSDKLFFFTQNSIAPYCSKGAHYGRLLEETIQELHADHAANDMRLLMEEAFLLEAALLDEDAVGNNRSSRGSLRCLRVRFGRVVRATIASKGDVERGCFEAPPSRDTPDAVVGITQTRCTTSNGGKIATAISPCNKTW